MEEEMMRPGKHQYYVLNSFITDNWVTKEHLANKNPSQFSNVLVTS